MKVGRYELLRRIAVGGMAEIFLARETGLAGFQRPAIVKRLLPALSVDGDFVEMFLDEARVAARLAHPNIVHIYELGRDGARYFIAMEYVPGCDLQTLLAARPGPMPVGEALFIAAEMLEGLSYAHSLRDERGLGLGLVHRDIAPKNVLVSLDGAVKIVDFGIAKARTKVFVTAPGMVLGTFNYMSPEHARGQPVDRRADLFATGAVLYRLVTGAPPYPGSDEGLVDAVRSASYPHPREVHPDLPDDVVAVVLRAMEAEPAARYQTAAEMRREVLRTLRRIGGGVDGERVAALLQAVLPDLERTVKEWLAGPTEDLQSAGGGAGKRPSTPPPRPREVSNEETVPIRRAPPAEESTADIEEADLWEVAPPPVDVPTVRLDRPAGLGAPGSTLDLALSPPASSEGAALAAVLAEERRSAEGSASDWQGEDGISQESATNIDLPSPETGRLPSDAALGRTGGSDDPLGETFDDNPLLGAALEDTPTLELLPEGLVAPIPSPEVNVPDLYEESEEESTDSTTFDMDPPRSGARRRRGSRPKRR